MPLRTDAFINVSDSITRRKERKANGRINMRDKGAVISDCRVSLGIIDEEDNNDTRVEEKKNPIFGP